MSILVQKYFYYVQLNNKRISVVKGWLYGNRQPASQALTLYGDGSTVDGDHVPRRLLLQL